MSRADLLAKLEGVGVPAGPGVEVVCSLGFSLSFAAWALMNTMLTSPAVASALIRTEGPKPCNTAVIASRRASASARLNNGSGAVDPAVPDEAAYTLKSTSIGH
jgi:hypothetical protein